MYRNILLVTFLFSTFDSTGQDQYKQALDSFIVEQQQEKVYLHFDKPFYGIGEEMFFKAYVTDGTFHIPLPIKSPLYIDLVSDEKKVVSSLKLPLERGTTNGSFRLEKNLRPGKYRVRAYTNWMRNFDQDFFFSKDFDIVNPEYEVSTQKEIEENKKILVDFMPEGGDLVDQLMTKMAIKTYTSHGKSVVVEGVIVDENGLELSTFKSNRFGHAICLLKPVHGIKYFASINGERYPLPEVKKNGIKLRITHSLKASSLNIAVLSNGISLKGGTLVAHQRGKHLFSLESNSDNNFAAKVEKEQLDAGICHFTFFDRNQVPVSERVVFVNIPEGIPIDISTNKESYATREAITVNFDSPVEDIQSASVTINPKKEMAYEAFNENIISYFFLDSDLKGIVEDPGYYFQQNDATYRDLDLLMLTQGWSRFNWQSLLDDTEYTPLFIQENGLTIRAQIVDYFDKDKPREGKFNVTIPNTGVLDLEGNSGPEGNFSVIGNRFYDSALVMISAHSFKGKKNKKDDAVSIKLVDVPTPPIVRTFYSDMKVTEEYEIKVDKLLQISKIYNLDPEATMLNEVVVTANARVKENTFEKRTKLYKQPSNRVVLDSVQLGLGGAATVFDYMRLVPGVRVNGIGADNTVTIRGLSSFEGPVEPLFVLDGIPVEKEVITDIPFQIVEFIDVLRGGKAAIYGSRGSNGVILIYTRTGAPESSKANIQRESQGLVAFKYPGYDRAKEFFSPRYDIPSESHAVPDFRTTLFWEPNLDFNIGTADIEFYTSDQKGDFTIRLEGILEDGTPFFSQGEFTVN